MKGKWKGKPVSLEQWQKDFISRFFGWKKISDGKRRFRTLFLFIPRKNGKSLIVAGIGLGMLLIDGEGGPEVYVGASNETQARGLFNVSKYMVKSDDDLNMMCEVLKDSIYAEHVEGIFRVITGVADSQEGLNPSAFLADEVHTFKDNSLLEVMETGQAAREQPGVFMMTTAGNAKQNNPAYQQYEYAKKVLEGVIIDPTYLAVLYEAPADLPWDSMEAAKAANPNFGITVFPEYFEQKIRKARHVPALVNSYKRHHLNIWCDADGAWLEYSKWLLCKKPFKLADLLGRKCYAGLDLAKIDDLSALVLLFPPRSLEEKYIVLARYWCPEEGIERRSSLAKVPYLDWSKNKDVRFTATPGEVTDYAFIERDIIRASKLFEIEELAFDPHNASYLISNLQEADIKCVGMQQGFLSMNEPVKNLIAMTLRQQLQHDDVVLDWMANNAVLSTDAHENVKFDKKKSAEKIDGMVALAMAVDRCLLNRDDGNDDDTGISII